MATALDALRKKMKLESDEYYNKLRIKRSLEEGAYNRIKQEIKANNQSKKYLSNTLRSEQNRILKSPEEIYSFNSNNNYFNVSQRQNERKNKEKIAQEQAKQELIKNQQFLKTSKTNQQLQEKINRGNLLDYQKNAYEVENKDVNLLDKINIGKSYLTGLESALDNPYILNKTKKYVDDNGNTYYLPSKKQMESTKLNENMGTIGKAIHGGIQSLGQMTPAMITSALPGGNILGPATTFATTMNSAKMQKLAEGYSDDQATKYAIVNAGLETALGKALGGATKIMGGKSSALSENIGKLTSKVIENKGLNSFISNLASEEIEEELQYVLDPINEYVTLGKYNNIGEALSTLDADDALVTALSTLVTIGLTEGPSAITESKMQKQIDSLNGKYNLDLKLKDTLDSATKTEIVRKKKEQQLEEIETRHLQLEQQYQNNEITEEEYNQETENINNELKTFKEDNDNDITDPIIETQAEKEILDNKLNSGYITQEKYDAEISKLKNKLEELNPKIKNFRESSRKYWEQKKQTKEVERIIEKIIAEKDYNVTLDPTIKTSYGQTVAGRITTNDNGEVDIKLNPDSDRIAEFLIVHEVTHAIETNEMRNLVMNFASKNKEFNNALQDLKNTYKTNDVSDEVLADISGQLLGNQEFINSLTIENTPQSRNIIQTIYESLKRMLNQLTSNGRYKNFVQDLESKWREAYQTQENNLNKKTKFSIQKDNNGNEYVNIDTDQDIFDGKNLAEQTKIAKQYILNNFRENGIDMNNENINVTSKTANEYTHPKKQLPIATKSSKMKASTELDNLLSISKYQNSSIDDGRHPFAKDGWDYYETVFKVGDNLFTGLINIGKSGKKKTLYDITKIKRIDQNRSTSAKAFTTSLVNSTTDNIPQSNTKVNSDTSSTKYSMQDTKNDAHEEKPLWQKFLDDNYKTYGTRTKMSDLKKNSTNTLQKVKTTENEVKNAIEPIKQEVKSISEQISELKQSLKVMNPNEISKLTKQDANTTPKLPIKNVSTGKGESSFYKNITEKTKMLSEEARELLGAEKDIAYYKEVTNEESLSKALEKLDKNGANETLNWFNKESKSANSVDVAEGWILMKQYENNKDYDGMVQVAKKLREIGTEAGQTVQAFNIMNRLTPEGMVKYAQSELTEAYEKMVKNKTKEWIDANKNKFALTPQETQFIVETMQEVSKMEDGYEKRVKLAEIQKLMTDKLPPEKGAGIKAWMRISMLFNPKTQVRNVVGNALIAPVNTFSDLFASKIDKAVAKKTGVRTTGTTNTKVYLKGMKTGMYQSYNDFKKGINTRNMEGNRFEIGQGKSFDDNKKLGNALNRVDNLLSFMLDAGDRMFYEASFTNSINNQLVLNNTTEVTQDMIDIATQEALSRTWQDNNKFTNFVLSARKGLNNFIGTENFGLGDVLIPFAKTPANLTKAIVDYSPVGVVNALTKGNNLKKSLSNGQYTAQMQHEFVQTLGKATAGTMLYILGIALAQAGISSGESDDDKDVASFLKNTLGVSSYSIKIGDKSFTYDWAQPIASPFSITANIVNSQNKEKALAESIVGNLDTAGAILLEQSFLQSINDVLNNTDGAISGLIQQVLDLPARAIPTFSKQIADLIDGTQRTTFEKNKPLATAKNKVISKLPVASKTLTPTVDTLGREIQKYGGKNGLFNVFFNPANVNSENISESAKEIYRIYQVTSDKTIFPRVPEYTYKDSDGNKIILSSKQRSDFQKTTGEIVEISVEKLLQNEQYNKLSDEDKASVIKDIVDYAYNKGRLDITGIPMSKKYDKINEYIDNGGTITNYYLNKEEVDYSLKYPSQYKYITSITDYNTYKKYKENIDDIRKKAKALPTQTRKAKVINYVNGLDLDTTQKAMLIKNWYKGFDNYNSQIISYVNSLKLSTKEKQAVLKEMGFKIKGGRIYW